MPLGRQSHLGAISIHALHEESDPQAQYGAVCAVKFQSTLSMRRATDNDGILRCGLDISIHALHEESDHHLHAGIYLARHISIHALHEESDFKWINLPPYIDISIHALHEESDYRPINRWMSTPVFQSTLSMRRATIWRRSSICPIRLFQSTLSMRRATYEVNWRVDTVIFQSTLSMRRATLRQAFLDDFGLFQSTLSMRRATQAIASLE